MKNYYNTCKNCGAHLDPDERCDCNKNVEDILTVAYNAVGKDKPCLVVTRRTVNDKVVVKNVIYGIPATLLYNNLIGIDLSQGPDMSIGYNPKLKQ